VLGSQLHQCLLHLLAQTALATTQHRQSGCSHAH
jgi:hypothetical protein